MNKRHGEYTTNILEQSEQIKDNNELYEKLKQKIKGRNIFLVLEIIVFLIIILVRCSAGLEQNTVVQKEDIHSVANTPDDEQKDGLYTITVDRIDISVNKDYSNEDTELYKACLSGEELTRGEAKELYRNFNLQTNTYYVKSSENVFAETYSEAGNSVTVDESLGLNGDEFINKGGYDVCFVADDCNQEAEPYSDAIRGYLMWKDYPDEDHCKEGASFVYIYNTEEVDKDVIAQTVLEKINEIQVPFGANRISLKTYGADRSNAFIDSYFFLNDIKPVIDFQVGIDSTFYIGNGYTTDKGYAFLTDNSNEENRNVGYYTDKECILTVDDETPNIHAVIINVDGFMARSTYNSENTGNLETDIEAAENEGYHN